MKKWFEVYFENLSQQLNFSHSIINNSNSPADLHQVFKQDTFLKSRARSASLLLPVIKTHYGEKTFQFIFIKFFNNFCKKDFFANYELFISNINRNLNCIFRNFIKIKFLFCKFLSYFILILFINKRMMLG